MAEGEYRDVPCDSRLNNAFDYQPVVHEGHYFWSQWHSDLATRPLPAWAWYRAYPNPDPVSDDERAIWKSAKIYVHCWVYRSSYFIQHHRDIVGRSGNVVANCDRTGPAQPLWAQTYDPYMADAPEALIVEECDGYGGGGGDGSGSGRGCTWVEIEISYDGGLTWSLLWSGYACNAQ
ncbi:MAG TPA: hypothetical protein VEY93_14180 [Longimicrobium sp.]|nr:hypothetical protein [Longimicrobium sp.]